MTKLFRNKIDISTGKIYSVKGDCEIMACNNNSGYLTGVVKDCYNNVYKSAHEVIYAEAHNLPKHLWGDYVINHKNENKHDNRSDNLELISVSDNLIYNNRHLKIGKKLRNRKDMSKQVYQYTLDGELVRIWQSTMEIERELGICHVNITQACNGGFLLHGKWVNKNTTKGYKWSFNPL